MYLFLGLQFAFFFSSEFRIYSYIYISGYQLSEWSRQNEFNAHDHRSCVYVKPLRIFCACYVWVSVIAGDRRIVRRSLNHNVACVHCTYRKITIRTNHKSKTKYNLIVHRPKSVIIQFVHSTAIARLYASASAWGSVSSVRTQPPKPSSVRMIDKINIHNSMPCPLQNGAFRMKYVK